LDFVFALFAVVSGPIIDPMRELKPPGLAAAIDIASVTQSGAAGLDGCLQHFFNGKAS
jgi:hypothetical protein